MDAALIPSDFMFNTHANDVEQIETALLGLQTFENVHSFADSAAQSLLKEKVGKAAFDCAKFSEAYRKIRDAAITFLNSSSATSAATAASVNAKEYPQNAARTIISGFTDVNLLADLIEDDNVDASISYERRKKSSPPWQTCSRKWKKSIEKSSKR